MFVMIIFLNWIIWWRETHVWFRLCGTTFAHFLYCAFRPKFYKRCVVLIKPMKTHSFSMIFSGICTVFLTDSHWTIRIDDFLLKKLFFAKMLFEKSTKNRLSKKDPPEAERVPKPNAVSEDQKPMFVWMKSIRRIV